MAHLDQEVNNNGYLAATCDNGIETAQETQMKTTIKVLTAKKPSEGRAGVLVEESVTYSPDELTVVTRADAGLYTKRIKFTSNGVEKSDYDNAKMHRDTVNVRVATMQELEAAIRDLSNKPKSCVIRGQLIDCYADLDKAGEVRRTHRSEWDAKSPLEWKTGFFVDVPRSWACIDIDGDKVYAKDGTLLANHEVIFPGTNLWTDATTPREKATQVATWLVNTWMPSNFNHKDAVVQWSSSYGLDGRFERVKAHVWVRLTKPLGVDVLGQWAQLHLLGLKSPDGVPYFVDMTAEYGEDKVSSKGASRLDYRTVNTPTQANYTATPWFTDAAGKKIPDMHADYRVIRVNGNGNFGYAVDSDRIVAEFEAASKKKAKKQAKTIGKTAYNPGGVPEVDNSDAAAQLSFDDWSPKDKSDYALAKLLLTYMGRFVDDYEPWYRTGMAIKTRFPGQEGLDLWTQWSLTSETRSEHEVVSACESKWPTFATEGSRIKKFGYLVAMARECGMPHSESHSGIEGAPEFPTFLAELEVEPKSKAAYRIQVSKAVALLMRDSEVCKLAAAYFDHAGETRLLDFLGTLAGFGATKAVVAQMAKKLTPRKAVELTLPLVDGHPIEMTEVPGFVVSNAGVYRETFSDVGERSLTKVLSQPLFILSEDTPLGVGHGDVVKLTLTWHKDNRWSTHRISAPDIAEKSKVVAVLSALGLEITSTVAVGVVDYIQAYRESNRVFIDKRTYTSRMGWQIRDGEVLGYTLGQTWIPFVGNDHGIDYQPEDGAKSDAANFSAKAGSLKSWSEMVSRLQGHPIAAAMLYASACAPLLHVVDAQGFTLDLGGKTSTGKTTTMRVAASVWGSPIDGDPRRVFSSWKTTINAFEARCARTNDLPLMLDDTKEASNPSLTSSAVYMITNGDSKERGTQTGSYRAGMKFRKVLISTGENLILDNNEHGGVRARVLSLTGLPLGSKSQEAGILARSLTTDASANYGHAGEALVRALCDGTLSWVDLRSEYTALKQALEATTGDESITARLAAYVALLQLAGRLLVNICGVDLPVDDHIAAIWTLCTKAATESDPVTNALSTIWGHQASHPHRLVGAVEAPHGGMVPNGGWLGKRAVLDGKPVVYVVADEAKRVLTDAGHNFAALCRSWVEDGLLAPDPDGKSARVTRIGGGSQRCLCFWQGKVEKAIGGVPDENDSPI